MTTLIQHPPRQTTSDEISLYRLSVEQYHQMIDAGVFKYDPQVELLEGYLVRTMGQNPPHAGALSRTLKRLMLFLASTNWVVRGQLPITINDSEPEPDIAVAEGPEDKFDHRHPVAKEVALIIESSESTLESDRTWKGRIYARARIPYYWIINLKERHIEVYSDPKGGKSPTYRTQTNYRPDDNIPLVLQDETVTEILVNELLPTQSASHNP